MLAILSSPPRCLFELDSPIQPTVGSKRQSISQDAQALLLRAATFFFASYQRGGRSSQSAPQVHLLNRTLYQQSSFLVISKFKLPKELSNKSKRKPGIRNSQVPGSNKIQRRRKPARKSSFSSSHFYCSSLNLLSSFSQDSDRCFSTSTSLKIRFLCSLSSSTSSDRSIVRLPTWNGHLN